MLHLNERLYEQPFRFFALRSNLNSNLREKEKKNGVRIINCRCLSVNYAHNNESEKYSIKFLSLAAVDKLRWTLESINIVKM